MATCSVCGGSVASSDRTCPFCGKPNPEFGLADASQDVDWMLLAEDTSLIAESAPAAGVSPSVQAEAPGDDWMLLTEDTSLLMEPAPPPSAPSWTPPPAQAEVPGDDWMLLAEDTSPPAQPTSLWAQTPAEQAPLPFSPFELESPPPAAPWKAPAPGPESDVDVELAPLQFSDAELTLPTTEPNLGVTWPGSSAGAGRVCSLCGKTYGADYYDTFCTCGGELTAAAALAAAPLPVKPPPGPARPPAGTRCLVLYGPDKRPVHYFPLNKDVLLIGRLDPVSGCFPDVDVSEWVDEATARKVSRRHALILRLRTSDAYSLRPLPGNTGTQVNATLLAGPEDVPLTVGTRVILGGVVRFKFEIT